MTAAPSRSSTVRPGYLLKRAQSAVDAIEEQMLARLSPAHRQQLTAALRTCIEALPQSRQPAP